MLRLEADVQFVYTVHHDDLASVAVDEIGNDSSKLGGIERSDRLETARHRFQRQCRRSDLRQPHDRFGPNRRRGVMGESATPIAERD